MAGQRPVGSAQLSRYIAGAAGLASLLLLVFISFFFNIKVILGRLGGAVG